MLKQLVVSAGLLAAGFAMIHAAGAGAQTPDREIRLIAQGDDMGAAHGINLGTIKAYKEGILRATNVLVPAAWTPEAAQLLKENPGLDVGVHLTLTSEWATVKWRPLTMVPSLADANGYFFAGVPAIRAAAGSGLNLAEIEKELRAQIELGKKMVPQASYMSTHMGFDSVSPEVRALVQKLSKEYRLVMAGAELGTQNMARVWNAADTADVRADKLVARLAQLQPGTWLWVEHCATDTPEVQAMGNNVAFDRSNVVAAWSDSKVVAAVKKYGIKLTSYKDLIARQ
jgi:chitin disaccharide deacetylase